MPTNTPIPTATNGTVISAATQNDIAVLNTSVGLFDATPAAVGTLPARNAPNFLKIVGTSVVTTNGSAVATVVFPTSFPNGVVAVTACPGDTNLNLSQVIVIGPTITTTGFQVKCNDNLGVGINSGVVRINWEATGF